MQAPYLTTGIDRFWETEALPTLTEYIRIPAKSPLFDADWIASGHIEAATTLLANWARCNAPPGMALEVIRLPGRTPLIYIEIPGAGKGSILFYGHLDKQPEMSGWRNGLGPWQPVREGDKLYGRGGADDGYALFCALAAILALHRTGQPYANLKIVIEASEESGSPDLPDYIDLLDERLDSPDLVVCLDSGCGNYDQLWCTTSLRGMTGGTLRVEVLNEGVHSGDAGGVVPGSFRIARELLQRIEEARSGRLLDDAFHVDIPPVRLEQAEQAAAVLGDGVYRRFPLAGRTRPQETAIPELILDRTWRPALEITGADGIPAIRDAGNVLRPFTALQLSLRLPPTCDATAAQAALERLLLDRPPHDARISFEPMHAADGWEAPVQAPWLRVGLEEASNSVFGRPVMYMGEGGSIPFMTLLGRKFPAAQFLITGVLGPQANAHGPNEFLHLPMVKKLTACVAWVTAAHYQEFKF
ncbi:MAG: M20/M25/M40 family metallo-hydrolase [Pseudomonadota bacterium]|nr:M20/M25/M40 family metallo-hydrolase [Pseudomonadota bacterium]